MQDRILELLKTDNRPFSIYDINDALGLKTVDELKELLKNLNELEDNLKVYRTKKDNYLLFNNSNLRVGTLIGNKKGFGFVDIEGNEDVFVAPINMNNAIHQDRVIVEITSKKGLSLEGRILRILKRELKPMVGLLCKDKKGYYVKLDDDKVKINVLIDNKDRNNAMEGHKVLVKVCNKLKNNDYKGQILKILGHKNDPGVDILSIVYKHQIEDQFSEEAIKELDYIKDYVQESETLNRVDLRNKMIFTIDGDDTKDIDDAISLDMLPNGNYKLGVHIADVSYYVKKGSKLDLEASERGTSVYLADRVIPMLPHKLSNGICSLNPNEDRLAITCDMVIDTKGKIINYDIYESVIRSNIQMTYNNVNSIFEKNIIPSGYEKYVDTLLKMKELAKLLRDYKTMKGYIDFGIDESKIIVDEQGKAIDVKLRYRGIAENMIEDFMIAANESVAEYMTNMELPFVYRVHGVPSEEKIDNFLKFIHVLGYNIDAKIKNITPKAMQRILEGLKQTNEYSILSNLLLRSMQKAVYSSDNIGHFGLASTCYTHFTSPIRRYPDQTVHRLLRTFIFNKGINKNNLEYWTSTLPFICEHSSYKERCSIDCEREVDDMKKAEYMEDHIGEEFNGIITTVTSFGMFVELPNLIEGLVKLDSLKGEYYYDEDTFSLKSKNNSRIYRLGDNIKVKVIAASKLARTIDFEVIEDGSKQQKSIL